MMGVPWMLDFVAGTLSHGLSMVIGFKLNGRCKQGTFRVHFVPRRVFCDIFFGYGSK